MPSIPLFVVTSIKQARRRADKNAYTARHTTEPMWQVKMLNGFFFGEGITFSYPDKQKAEVFSAYEIYNPNAIIQEAAPKGEPFTVQDIYKTKGPGPINPYTDKMEVLDNWTVSLEGPSGTYIDLWYPYPPPGFAMSRSYTVQDLFGTIKAPAFDNSQQLQAAIGGAFQQKTVSKTHGPATPNYPPATQQTAADIAALNQAASALSQAAFDESQASEFSTDPTISSSVANAVLNHTSSVAYLGQVGTQEAYFWITDGGSSGWYAVGTFAQLGFDSPANQVYYGYYTQAQLEAGGYVHYATGTFNSPANGLLIGDYESDASVQAGHVLPTPFTSGGG